MSKNDDAISGSETQPEIDLVSMTASTHYCVALFVLIGYLVWLRSDLFTI